MQTLVEQLRAIRRASGLSQRALGARVGLPQSHISSIESGSVDPRLSSVVELARQLDHEVVLVPRAMLPAVRAMLRGTEEAPLWQAGDEEDA